MATPRLGLVVEDKPTELSCICRGQGTGLVTRSQIKSILRNCSQKHK